MALDSVDTLSDDNAPSSSLAAVTNPAPESKTAAKGKGKGKGKNKSKGPKSKSEPKLKEESKETSSANPVSDEASSSSGLPVAVAKPKPKAESKRAPKPLKRPAAASHTADEPAMKRPAKGAGRKGKDPDRVSVCKSKYKSNGVWSIKLWQKEVIRVFGLH